MKIAKYLIFIFLFASGYGYGQENNSDQLSVSFTDPNKPGTVKINLQIGNLHVIGYNGKQVLIDSKIGPIQSFQNYARPLGGGSTISPNNPPNVIVMGNNNDDEPDKNTEGMHKLSNTSAELRIEEEDNIMEIRTGSILQSVDLTVRVPLASSLNLGSMGPIAVENVRGEITIGNGGPINLQNVTGPVVAQSLSSDITATFMNPLTDQPISFTTMGGDIDITFPSNLKADLKIKSQMGEIYTGYEVTMKNVPERMQITDERSSGGSYQMEMEKIIHAVVNNGGTEINFNTFSGDIFIRKAE